ncbi:MAG: F0F1 ATP synthase subunit A [Pseudomonadota bacterium]
MAAGKGPLDQFVIKEYVPLEFAGLDVSFTNSSLWMIIAVVLTSALFVISIQGRSLIPGRAQSVAELYYEFVHNMVRNGVGADGMKFFPFVFTLFTFILMCNMLGMIPWSFTVTSHIIVTFALALLVMSVVILYGIYKNGVGFLKLFVPDVPVWLLPVLIPIEIISFLSRPVSLSVRLFANMLAGHITLKVFAGFVISMAALGPLGVLGAVMPLLLTLAMTMLEFLVAFLQAFVFATLTCMYLHDALHPSH